MRRVATVVLVLSVLAVGAVASTVGATGSASATKLTIWVGWSARELSEFKKVVAEYDRKNAAVEVKVVGGINDDKITAALRSGNGPDVVSSFTSQNVGVYCKTGGWIDLAPYLKRDKIDVNIFPAATRYYTQYQGTRCALPLLADAYGFYYNKALFKKAGLTRPPRTLAELSAYAKKLTTRKADGSLDVVGYDPVFGFYQNSIGAYQPLVGAKYFDVLGQVEPRARTRAGRSCCAGRRALVDYVRSTTKLVKWQTGAGDEWSAPHAFERGKLAMMIDGEWRVAFIAAEHPELELRHRRRCPSTRARRTCTAPATSTARSSASPRTARTATQAWELVKYLTTNNHALATFSNGIRNVPSTKSCGEVAGAEAGQELRRVHEDLRRTRSPRRSRSPRSARRTSRPSRASSPSGRRAR